jgi:hypothetical protein
MTASVPREARGSIGGMSFYNGPPTATGSGPLSSATPATAAPPPTRWSVQEIRRIANRLAQQRIYPARISLVSLATHASGRRAAGPVRIRSAPHMLSLLGRIHVGQS